MRAAALDAHAHLAAEALAWAWDVPTDGQSDAAPRGPRWVGGGMAGGGPASSAWRPCLALARQPASPHGGPAPPAPAGRLASLDGLTRCPSRDLKERGAGRDLRKGAPEGKQRGTECASDGGPGVGELEAAAAPEEGSGRRVAGGKSVGGGLRIGLMG